MSKFSAENYATVQKVVLRKSFVIHSYTIFMQDDFKSKLKIGILILLFVIIGGYTIFRTKDLIVGVRLKVSGITEYESRTDPLVTLSGNARRAVELTINGRKIFITENGDFNEKLLLLPGLNIITVQAVDKFGKSKEKIFHLNFENKSSK